METKTPVISQQDCERVASEVREAGSLKWEPMTYDADPATGNYSLSHYSRGWRALFTSAKHPHDQVVLAHDASLQAARAACEKHYQENQ